MSVQNDSLFFLKKASYHLAHLREKIVFVGGSILGILITDKLASKPRMSFDVDCIVEVVSFLEYRKLSNELLKLGFKQPSDKTDILCRHYLDDIILDVMPINNDVLGFSNRWYPNAMQYATSYQLDDQYSIKHIDAPHFIATKLEAFAERGNEDYLMSHDLEDIVSILDGRPGIVTEIL